MSRRIYSLIIDAIATVEVTPGGPCLHLAPTRSVLHQPVPAPDPSTSACGSDCVPLAIGTVMAGGGLSEREA